MIKKLTKNRDKELIIEFCMEHERENIFILGDMNRVIPYHNKYYGYFDGSKLVGLAAFFIQFESFVVHSQNEQIIVDLTHYALHKNCRIKYVPCFKKYADTIVKVLINEGMQPKKIGDEMVLELDYNDFQSCATGAESVASQDDIDPIIMLQEQLMESDDVDNTTITDEEREKIRPEENFILKIDKEIVSKANLHGVSDNYFQIGGIITPKQYRRKGYAKRVLSALCEKYFERGERKAILFTDHANLPALALYKSLGFKEIDRFVLARF